jgi:outer membrane immunogenic protein
MKSFCMAFVMLGLVAVATPALASDWDGVYYGLNGGTANGSGAVKTTTPYVPTAYFAQTSTTSIASTSAQTINTSGFAGGGTLGINSQRGGFVMGLEADYGSMNLAGSATSGAVYPCCGPSSYTIVQKYSTNSLLTVRPRFGLAMGKAMLYGTVGMGMTTINYSSTFSDTYSTPPAAESGAINKSVLGLSYGGGVEARLDAHWSVKGEYIYNQFGTQTVTSTNLAALGTTYPTQVFTHSINLNTNVLRFGINYR